MSFCPFFKEDCKENQCVMWLDENCMVVNFLQKIHTAVPSDEDLESEPIGYVSEPFTTSIPEYIQASTPESLVSDYVTFLRDEFPDSESRPYGMWELFIQSKGLSGRFGLPSDTAMKLGKARALADIELSRLRDTERKERLEREQIEVPSLVDKYIDWLDEKKLQKVRLADVSRFTTEFQLDLLRDTERDIYDKAQLKMESRHEERMLQERQEVPSLVDQCMDWARANSLSRLTKSDCESFLIEYDLDVLKETKDRLYAIANTKLKAKK